MTWVVEMRATYESEDGARRAHEVAGVRAFEGTERLVDGLTVRRRGRVLVASYDYGARSKYDAVRPALFILQEVFDPIADDEFYRPWPLDVRVRSRWVESPA